MTTSPIPLEDLPVWMRRAQRGVNWGIFVVLAFGLTAAWSFILQPGLPHNTANDNYAFRVENTATALQEGRLYPRWSPHALNGYGAPIPNYEPPGAVYSAAVLRVLFTRTSPQAMRLIYIAAYCLAGVTTYTLVSRRVSAEAGMLASVVYVYSPYFGLVAPHQSGDFPAVVALALLPLLLMTVDRMIYLNHPLDTLFLVLVTACLYLTHPQIACVGTLIVLGIAGWHIVVGRHRTRALYTLIMIGLGLCLASFYLLPAWLERDLVVWREPFSKTPLLLTLETIFLPLRQIDLGALNRLPQLTLGVVPTLLWWGGALGVLVVRRRGKYQTGMLVVGAGILVIALMMYSTQIWVLGIVSFCMAVGGSAVLNLRRFLPTTAAQLLLPIILVFALIGSRSVWLAALWDNPDMDTSPQAQLAYELDGNGIAVLPPTAYVPTTLADTLPLNRALIDGYRTGNINRLPLAQTTSGSQANVLEQNSHEHVYLMQTTEPLTADMLLAYFPGWQAGSENRAVSINVAPETGLVQLNLPQLSNDRLRIHLGTTPIRFRAWLVSALALLVILVITVGRLRLRTDHLYDDVSYLTMRDVRLLLVLLVAFIIVVGVFAVPFAPLSLRQPPGYTLRGSTSVRSRTDVGLQATAFQLTKTELYPDEAVELTLYWHALRFLVDNYRVRVFLINTESGERIVSSGFRHPGDMPTRRWNTNQFVRDPYRLMVPVDALPDDYLLGVEAYTCLDVTCEAYTQLTFFNTAGQPYGGTLVLPTLITVLP